MEEPHGSGVSHEPSLGTTGIATAQHLFDGRSFNRVHDENKAFGIGATQGRYWRDTTGEGRERGVLGLEPQPGFATEELLGDEVPTTARGYRHYFAADVRGQSPLNPKVLLGAEIESSRDGGQKVAGDSRILFHESHRGSMNGPLRRGTALRSADLRR